MDRTVSEGRSIVSAGAQTESPTSLMGQLRCLYEHHGRTKSYGFKKLFWVVNEAKSCLEVYKNDQVYIPMDIIKAVELRSVTFAADKQNRFYVMVLQLRRSYDVKFRMNSPEERDRWSAAINHLIATFSTTNQRKTTLGQVIRHIAIASRQLGIQIAVDTGMILTEISDDLLQYVVEAVDTALNTIAVITHSGERDVPRHYTLELRNISDYSDWDQRSTYDPTSRSVLLQVGLYRDVLNHVQFCCTEPEDVLLMMQSGVYRNPTIEGWLDNDVGCVRGRRSLNQYINAERPLSISLQFAQNVRDSGKVEAYLRRFVSEPFFDNIIALLQATVDEMVWCVERLRGQPPGEVSGANSPSGAGAAATTPPPTGSQPLMVRGQSSASFFDGMASPTRHTTGAPVGGGAASAAATRRGYAGGGSGMVGHSRSRSGGGAGAGQGAGTPWHNRTASTMGLFHRGTSSFPSASFAGPSPTTDVATPTDRMALGLLLETVDGLSVLLEAFKVDSCSQPPTVILNYAPSYGKKYRRAMLLESKFFEAFPESSLVTINARYTPLKDQLHQLSLRVLLAHLMQTLKSRLSAVCSRKNIRVSFQWGTLFSAIRQVTTNYNLHDRNELLRIVASVMNVYEARLLQLVQQLTDIPIAQTDLGNVTESNANLFSLFSSCVWCINVVFAHCTMESLRDPDGVASALPKVSSGVLTDTILIVPEDLTVRAASLLVQSAEASLSATLRTPPTAQGSSPLLPKIVFLPAVVRLGKWCANYFGQRDNIIPYDPNTVRVELDSDSDDGTESNATNAVDLDFGDAVATERSAENTFLSMQRVVNSVYDQQGPSVDLKISATDIRKAVRSLQKALDSKHRISKHDTEHIMTTNLHKLRRMYTAALDEDEVGSRFLTQEEAETLLRTFCEYEENERDISLRLRSAPVSERVQATTGCNPDATSGSIGLYDFAAVARVALNDLLPLEAVVSRKAWRNGFLFGLTNTGKSLITNCLRGMSRSTVATVGLARQVVSFGEWVLALHELGGRDSFRTNWQFYARRLPKVNFLIFVLDAMNKRSFTEAHQYLGEVASAYPTKPLLIILNNYREHPIPMPLEQLLRSISLDKIRKENPERKVIVCTTDLTIVHSANRTVPAKLHKGMEQLCQVLLSRSSEDSIPSTPKPDPPLPESKEWSRGSPSSVPSSMPHAALMRSNGANVLRIASLPRRPSSHPAGGGGSGSGGTAGEAVSGSWTQSPLVRDTTKSVFQSGYRDILHTTSGVGGGSGAPGGLRQTPDGAGSSPSARQPPSGWGPASASHTVRVTTTRTTPGTSEVISDASLQSSAGPVPATVLTLDAPGAQSERDARSRPDPAAAAASQPASQHAPFARHGQDSFSLLTQKHVDGNSLCQNDSDVVLHQGGRMMSETYAPESAYFNSAAQGGRPGLTAGSSPSVALFKSPASSSALASSSSSIFTREISLTTSGGRAARGETRVGRGLRGDEQIEQAPTPLPNRWAARAKRPHSISVTQSPETFRDINDQADAAAGAGGRSEGVTVAAAPPANMNSPSEASALRLGKSGSLPSRPRRSGSGKEPDIRLPVDLDDLPSSDLVCTPAPILEDRPSVTHQRSHTAMPQASPSPKNHPFTPLVLSSDVHSPKLSSSDTM